MSQMLTNIRRVVGDVSSRKTMLNDLFEAITNSIHANATHIICRFETLQDPLEIGETEPKPRRVISIEVEDNGDGFTDKNFESFGEYRTDYKENLGCKGIGRFVFLKHFKKVSYESWIVELQERRKFVFGFDFEKDHIEKKEEEITANKTILRLCGLTDHCHDSQKHIDKRMEADLPQMKEDILSHLIPTLFLYKKKQTNITIDLVDIITGGTPVTITDADIPDFTTAPFAVHENSVSHPFTLHYTFSSPSGPLRALHCANNRTVSRFSEHDLNISLPQNRSGYFLLESTYFDEHVDNDRNEFRIYPVKTDLFTPLSWEMINSSLKQVISGLINANIPDALNINQTRLAQIVTERPYLSEYIEIGDTEIAGFIDSGQIIKKAKKRFEAAKDSLLTNAGKAEYTDADLYAAIQVAQSELVAYVQDRVLVIERLTTMLGKRERIEKIIHDLFMKKATDGDYESIKNNNLWLLDDRFTSYSYAASDKRIHEIRKNVGLTPGLLYDNNKPDFALFFSQNPVDKIGLKSVVIELKPFTESSQADRDKFAGIQELIDHIKAFQSHEDIKETWAFLVTDVDDKLADRLTTDGYKPLFSTERAIYSRYYDTINASIYVLSVQTLIADAAARNRIFIDIIHRQNKLKNIFKDFEPELDVSTPQLEGRLP